MHSNAFNRIVDALKAAGCTVFDTGPGKAYGQCPAHDDGKPSLTVTAIEGQTLIHCHGGCDTADVTGAIGLTIADLFDQPDGVVYRYDGGRNVRRTPDKQFKQWGSTSTFDLYRLSNLAKADLVYLVEGEKDVHALETLGVVATTAPMGADSFAKVDVTPLTGKTVVAVVDRDKAGQKWAASVVESLDGIVTGLTFVAAKEGKDAADHVAAGYGLDDFEPVDRDPTPLERLRSALLDTDSLDSIADPELLIGKPDAEVIFRDSLVWMVGVAGDGKSFVALDMAGCVATGSPWQGHPVTKAPVLILVAEGARGTKKRVRAWEHSHGRKMTGVAYLPLPVQSTNPTEWDALVRLSEQERYGLVVIDTQARVTVGVEENSNREMGVFVAAAERLRMAAGATVMIIHHIGRQGETGRGASTLDGALSTIIKVTKKDDLVTLQCTKQKDAPEWEGMTLRMEPVLESVVLRDAGLGFTAKTDYPKWLDTWWELFKNEWTSITALVKADVTSEATFHRNKQKLIDDGLVEAGGGQRKQYRLTHQPGTQGHSHTLTSKEVRVSESVESPLSRQSREPHESVRAKSVDLEHIFDDLNPTYLNGGEAS